MPRASGTTFGDLVGELNVVVVECPKCSRTGRYAPRRRGGAIVTAMHLCDNP
jgi:hypothetical protein